MANSKQGNFGNILFQQDYDTWCLWLRNLMARIRRAPQAMADVFVAHFKCSVVEIPRVQAKT